MHTKAQKRGALLANRLSILNAYLVDESSGPIADWFKSKGIKGGDFFRGLPEGFVLAPDADRKDVEAFTNAMNDLYIRQYMIHTGEAVEEEETLNADGNGTNTYNERIMERGLETPGTNLSAEGCGLPPVRPLRSREKVPEKWAAYDKKKAEYDKCREAKKADKPGKGKKGLHAINKYNPVMVAGRKAFFGLLRVNFLNLAGNLGRILDYSTAGGKTAAAKQSTAHYLALWKKVEAKWYNLGGDVSALKKNIKKGQFKKALFKKKNADGSYNADPVTTAVTLMAAAAPVLASVGPIIKALKKGEGEPLDEETPETLPDTIPDDAPGPEEDPNGETFWEKYKTAIYITIGVVVLIGGIITVVYFVRKKGK